MTQWSAIEQRRPSLIATDGIEKREMENAQTGLLAAEAERTGAKMFQSALELLVQSNGQKGPD
jgi:hypothetical protein